MNKLINVRGYLETILIVFIILKLTNLVSWSWWIVLLPFCIPLLISILIPILVMIFFKQK
ncbi:MAG: hypothetical protein BV456_00920 [Thermoplasmata archaeon M8B2D]|nr:MAG: hypothetical protein BV456_00920 [Thermoplasmata archaeon M8B2D]